MKVERLRQYSFFTGEMGFHNNDMREGTTSCNCIAVCV